MEKKKTKVISNIIFMLRYVLKFTPGYFINLVLTAILFQIEVFFEFTYCMKYLLDLIQYGGSFQQAIKYMLIVATMVMVKIIWAALINYKIAPKAKEKLHKELQEELYRQATLLDLSRYDDPNCYNEFVFSVSQASNRIDTLLRNIESFCSLVTGIFTSSIFLISLDKMGFIFVLLSLLITFVVNHVCSQLQFEMDKNMNPIHRKRNYFSRVFYLSDYAKEIRLHNMSHKLQKEFHETNKEIVPVVKKYGRKQIPLLLAGGWVADNLVMDVGYMGYLLYQTVIKGAFSYGSLLGLSDSARRLKGSLRRIAELLPRFRQDSFYIDKIREFLSFEAQIKGGDKQADKEEFRSLQIRGISFGYDEDNPIINNLSLSIKAGEKIAIVGYNGTGKTTLIKLLMRLYDVNSGKILLNGNNIKEYDVDSYRGIFGSVFQDYKIYGASLAENVKMDIVEEANLGKIEDALIKSGFEKRLKSLEQGLETGLTREFDDKGVNLSGGESQKVAISRAFYGDCPIIILDEPSSALDPVSEYYLNDAMMRAAEHKTVIFISHRLSSARMADTIYMLENGRILEQGSHQELMELGGKYAQMYKVQAEKYQQVEFARWKLL